MQDHVCFSSPPSSWEVGPFPVRFSDADSDDDHDWRDDGDGREGPGGRDASSGDLPLWVRILLAAAAIAVIVASFVIARAVLVAVFAAGVFEHRAFHGYPSAVVVCFASVLVLALTSARTAAMR